MFDALEIFTNVLPSNNCIGDEGGGNGTDNTGSHHIWVLNSDWHGCGQSGLQWNNTDWLFAIHNVFHDNSSNASFGVFGSGISFYDPVGKTGYSPTTEDNKWCSATNSLCYHMVIAYNVGYHNFNIQSGTGNSDGEGIILDDFQHGQNACPGTGTCPYTGNVLVMGNIMYNNGGSGIENNSKFSGTTTLVNNTMYSNNWDTHNTGTFRGGIYSQDDLNTVSINNVSYAVLGAGILASNSPYLGQCNNAPPCAGLVWQTNLSFPGGDNNFDNTFNVYSTTGTNKNLDGSDPKFVNASTSTPNFALQGTSPAIGFGQAFDLFRASGPVDAGACPSSLTICP
jgi:serralysin